MAPIALAYTGGFDTSVALRWLARRHQTDVVTVTLDVGQGWDLEEARDRALALGAARAHVLDVRDEFARDFVSPSLKADAVHASGAPMAVELVRCLVARKLVEVAHMERASTLAHAARGGGSVIGAALRALSPDRTVVACAAESGSVYSAVIEDARSRGVTLPPDRKVDANLWCRTLFVVDGDQPTSQAYLLTRPPADCPSEPATVRIAFERGAPTSINGISMPLVDLIASLTVIAGAHGVGRIGTFDGRGPATSRTMYEAPAAVVLHAAHASLQRYVVPEATQRRTRDTTARYAALIGEGSWFDPRRTSLDESVAAVQALVNGAVQVKLFKGGLDVAPEAQPAHSRLSVVTAL